MLEMFVIMSLAWGVENVEKHSKKFSCYFFPTSYTFWIKQLIIRYLRGVGRCEPWCMQTTDTTPNTTKSTKKWPNSYDDNNREQWKRQEDSGNCQSAVATTRGQRQLYLHWIPTKIPRLGIFVKWLHTSVKWLRTSVKWLFLGTAPVGAAAFLRPFGSKRPQVERPSYARLPVAFPLTWEGSGCARVEPQSDASVQFQRCFSAVPATF